MIDPYYRVRSQIHRDKPAYGYLMIAWTAAMATVAGVFGWYWFNMEVDTQCYVRKGDDKPLDHSELLQPSIGKKDIDNVSTEFDQVLALQFVACSTAAIISFYHVLSIFVYPELLKYSHPVGLFNKLNIAFLVICFVFMHVARFTKRGRICSGDFYDEATSTTPSEPDTTSYEVVYLVSRGRLLKYYIVALWTLLGTIFASIGCFVYIQIKSM